MSTEPTDAEPSDLPPVPYECPVDVGTGKVGRRILCIPFPFSGEDWQRFYLAVRMMVGQKRRGLLDAWDQIGIHLHHEMQYGDDEKVKAELLEQLCEILENPNAKPVRFFFHRLRELYDRTKAILTAAARRCRDVRRRGAPQAQDEPDANRLGESTTPRGSARIDSVEFYRSVLQDVYGNWVGQDSPYSCPREVLEGCKALVSHGKPAEAALVILAAWTGLEPQYLMKRLYTRPHTHRIHPAG